MTPCYSPPLTEAGAHWSMYWLTDGKPGHPNRQRICVTIPVSALTLGLNKTVEENDKGRARSEMLKYAQSISNFLTFMLVYSRSDRLGFIGSLLLLLHVNGDIKNACSMVGKMHHIAI